MKKVFSVIILSSLLLVACSSKKSDASEQDRFISAMTEATCAAFASGDITEDIAKQKTIEIFSKYGFDANDEAVMTSLQTKYQDNKEVDTALQIAFQDCAPQEFLDAMKALGDGSSVDTDVSTDASADATIPTDDATAKDETNTATSADMTVNIIATPPSTPAPTE